MESGSRGSHLIKLGGQVLTSHQTGEQVLTAHHTRGQVLTSHQTCVICRAIDLRRDGLRIAQACSPLLWRTSACSGRPPCGGAVCVSHTTGSGPVRAWPAWRSCLAETAPIPYSS